MKLLINIQKIQSSSTLIMDTEAFEKVDIRNKKSTIIHY